MRVHKLTMEESTVSLVELEEGCCQDGMAKRIGGSLNTFSVFDREVLEILSVDVVFSRLLRTLISRKAKYALCLNETEESL